MVATAVYHVPGETLTAIKSMLQIGWTVVFGYSGRGDNMNNEDTKRTGILALPRANGDQWGHCVLAVGYDDTRQLLKFKNSWGTDWGVGKDDVRREGQNGYMYLPYTYAPWMSDPFVIWQQEFTYPFAGATANVRLATMPAVDCRRCVQVAPGLQPHELDWGSEIPKHTPAIAPALPQHATTSETPGKRLRSE
jgi:hypothetical protein